MSTAPAGPAVAAPAIENPFPGLRPFQPGEEHLFFGREHQIDAMIDKLARSRFLAVIGTSGSGKSSLVNCGLRPALHRGLMAAAGPSWRTISFRPGGDPIRALATSLATQGALYGGGPGEGSLRDVIETHLRLSSRGLVEVIERAGLPPRTNLLVIADQFEELFRYRNAGARRSGEGGGDDDEDEDATAFVNLLHEAVRDPHPIYVVLTMRSDFLGDCARFHGLPEAMNEAQYLVPRLSRQERRAAIVGPITISAAEPHPVLLTRLVNDVGDDPDQLSILQHALNRTWARWRVRADAGRPIVIDDYTDIGTMSGALDRHAEKAFAELGDERLELICERMFKALTDRGTDARGVRRPTTVERLCAITDATPEELARVIDVFRKPSRSFLMPPRSEPLEPGTVIDISHESLMRVWRRLERWTEEEARSARLYRRLAESAALHAERKASLWRDPELRIALGWRRRRGPTAAWAQLYDDRFDVSMAFLDASRDARQQVEAEAELQRAWVRIRIGLLCAAAICSVGVLVWVISTMPNLLDGSGSGSVGGSNVRFGEAMQAVSLLALAVAAPPILALLIGEYFLRPLHRERGFAAAIRRVAAREAEFADGPDVLPLEPDVRWETTYAPVWRRALATVLDVLIGLVLVVVGIAIIAPIYEGVAGKPMAGSWLLAGPALGLVLGLVYHAATVSADRGATYGMRAMRIFVVDERGAPASWQRAVLRHLCKVPNALYGLPLLLYFRTKRRQTLHDLLSGTVVLNRPRSGGSGAPRDGAGDLPDRKVRLPGGHALRVVGTAATPPKTP